MSKKYYKMAFVCCQASVKITEMKEYRLTIYNDMTNKKRRINVRGQKIESIIEYANFHILNHVMEEIIKIERWDNRK